MSDAGERQCSRHRWVVLASGDGCDVCLKERSEYGPALRRVICPKHPFWWLTAGNKDDRCPHCRWAKNEGEKTP